MKKSFFAFVAAVTIVATGFVPAQAPCPQPDGFSGGAACCAPANPNLPNFPTLTLQGLGACIRDCNVENQINTITTLAPQQILCDYWIINVSVTSPPMVAIVNQMLVAKYARTWLEFPATAAAPIQVWRFLVNGDLTYGPTPVAAGGCPIPLSALPPFNLPVHFVGNVDYAFNCATGAWSVAYTLSHLCPTEMHAPFSQRPIAAAAGWAKRTYHFVGPANFVFGMCPPPDGAIVAESTRTSVGLTNPAVPYTCLRETQVNQGILQNQFQNCVCFDPTPVGPPPRYTHQFLNATEFCAGAVAPIASFGGLGIPFLPTGLRALTIGFWTPVATQTYPAGKCVSVYLGVLQSPGICPTPSTVNALHAVTGVGTTGGNPVQLMDSPLTVIAPFDFLDIENMLVLTPVGFTPGLGSLFGSERVWSFNML